MLALLAAAGVAAAGGGVYACRRNREKAELEKKKTDDAPGQLRRAASAPPGKTEDGPLLTSPRGTHLTHMLAASALATSPGRVTASVGPKRESKSPPVEPPKATSGEADRAGRMQRQGTQRQRLQDVATGLLSEFNEAGSTVSSKPSSAASNSATAISSDDWLKPVSSSSQLPPFSSSFSASSATSFSQLQVGAKPKEHVALAFSPSSSSSSSSSSSGFTAADLSKRPAASTKAPFSPSGTFTSLNSSSIPPSTSSAPAPLPVVRLSTPTVTILGSGTTTSAAGAASGDDDAPIVLGKDFLQQLATASSSSSSSSSSVPSVPFVVRIGESPTWPSSSSSSSSDESAIVPTVLVTAATTTATTEVVSLAQAPVFQPLIPSTPAPLHAPTIPYQPLFSSLAQQHQQPHQQRFHPHPHHHPGFTGQRGGGGISSRPAVDPVLSDMFERPQASEENYPQRLPMRNPYDDRDHHNDTSLTSPSSLAFAIPRPADLTPEPPRRHHSHTASSSSSSAASSSSSSASLAAALGYEGPPPGAEPPVRRGMNGAPIPSNSNAPANPALAAALGYLPADSNNPSSPQPQPQQPHQRVSLGPYQQGRGLAPAGDGVSLIARGSSPLPPEALFTGGSLPPQISAALLPLSQSSRSHAQHSYGASAGGASDNARRGAAGGPALPDFFASADDSEAGRSGLGSSAALSEEELRRQRAMAAEMRARQIRAQEEERKKRVQKLPGFFEEDSAQSNAESGGGSGVGGADARQLQHQQMMAAMAERQRRLQQQQQQQQQRTAAASADPFFNAPADDDSSNSGPATGGRAGGGDDDEIQRRRALAALGLPDLPLPPPPAPQTAARAGGVSGVRRGVPALPPSTGAPSAVHKALRLTDDDEDEAAPSSNNNNSSSSSSSSIMAARRALMMTGPDEEHDDQPLRNRGQLGGAAAVSLSLPVPLPVDLSALEPVLLARQQQQQQQQQQHAAELNLEGLGLSLSDLGVATTFAAVKKPKRPDDDSDDDVDDGRARASSLPTGPPPLLPWELELASIEEMVDVVMTDEAAAGGGPNARSSGHTSLTNSRSASPTPSTSRGRGGDSTIAMIPEGSPYLVKSVAAVVPPSASFPSPSTTTTSPFSLLGFQQRQGRWGGLDIGVAALVVQHNAGDASAVAAAEAASNTAAGAIAASHYKRLSRRLRRDLVKGISLLSSLRHPNLSMFLGAVLATDNVVSASSSPAALLPSGKADLLLVVSEHQSAGTLSAFLRPPLPRTASFQGHEYELPSKLPFSASTPLPWSVIRSLALDVARGMTYLHGSGNGNASSVNASNNASWHGCLHPASCLVGEGMRVKISSLSLVPLLASAIHRVANGTITRPFCEAQAAAMLAPACYLAPEILRKLGGFHVATASASASAGGAGSEAGAGAAGSAGAGGSDHAIVTQACDVFSFGMMLWEIVERRQPFQADRGIPTVVAARILAGERPPLPDPMGPRFVTSSSSSSSSSLLPSSSSPAPASPPSGSPPASSSPAASMSVEGPKSVGGSPADGGGAGTPPATAAANTNGSKGLATRKAFLGLMQRCWAADPKERPTFAKIVAELEKMALY